MILVTVGTKNLTDDSLFRLVDDMVSELNEEVLIQTARSNFNGKNSKCVPFFTEEEMKSVFDMTDLLICIPGIGTILNGLNRNIPMVLYYDYDEYRDDMDVHDVAYYVQDMGRAVVADHTNLYEKIQEARGLKFGPYKANTQLVDTLDFVLTEYSSKLVKK